KWKLFKKIGAVLKVL
nr:Chain A, CM15 [synthetic construct]